MKKLLILLFTTACSAPDLPRAPEVGALAPEYSAVVLDGDSVSLAARQGDVVLFNVWATWCIPCREETPALQRLYERFQDRGLRIVGVSIDAPGEEASIRQFVRDYGVTYEIWHDPADRVTTSYRLVGVPNTFLIDREGIVRWKHMGPVTEDDPGLLAALEAAL